MRSLILSIAAMLLFSLAWGQEKRDVLKGKVSYVTTQNVYVKFESTRGIEAGDTLYILENGQNTPALIVQNLSSISCVCVPLADKTFKVEDEIQGQVSRSVTEKTEPAREIVPNEDTLTEPKPASGEFPAKPEQALLKQKIYGRLGVSSYSNFTNEEDGNNQRMRYVAALNADNIQGTKLGLETYISFSHKDEQWESIKANIYEGLKIYSLALHYAFNERTELWLGRKINRNLSSMGAVDGLQLEKKLGAFSAGLVIGSRPDYSDYSYNSELFQAGVYVGHQAKTKNGFLQSSVALVDQENKWNTDRRFLYIQHSNSLVKNLYFFASGEMDLYEKIEGVASNTFKMTNTYISLRYNVLKNLRISASYNARNNIIYYETNKTFIDRLLDYETLNGYRFLSTYKPFKNISLGFRAGYRYRKTDDSPTRNLYSWLSFQPIPFLNASATLSSTILETSYLKGKVYGLYLNKDLIKAKVFAGLTYRYTDYTYLLGEINIVQHSGELSLMWRLFHRLTLSVNDEMVFEGSRTYNRLYISLNKRF